MKYRRMEFNAQLQEEVTKLRAELDALREQEPVAWIDGGDARALMQGNSVMVHPADQGLMAPLYAAPVPSRDEVLEALGNVALRFADRAGDVCPEDPAEKICAEFAAAVYAVLNKATKEKTE
jgi:hypothetical protein